MCHRISTVKYGIYLSYIQNCWHTILKPLNILTTLYNIFSLRQSLSEEKSFSPLRQYQLPELLLNWITMDALNLWMFSSPFGTDSMSPQATSLCVYCCRTWLPWTGGLRCDQGLSVNLLVIVRRLMLFEGLKHATFLMNAKKEPEPCGHCFCNAICSRFVFEQCCYC